MKIKVTDEDMQTILSEMTAHKDKPRGHSDCEFCDWIEEFSKTDTAQALAELSDNSVVYLDRLYFLFAGVKLGRRQGMDDFIRDLEDPQDHSVEWESQIDENPHE